MEKVYFSTANSEKVDLSSANLVHNIRRISRASIEKELYASFLVKNLKNPHPSDANISTHKLRFFESEKVDFLKLILEKVGILDPRISLILESPRHYTVRFSPMQWR